MGVCSADPPFTPLFWQAKAAAQSEQLQREKLAGKKKVEEATAQDENAGYKLTVRVGPGRVDE